MKDLNTIYFCSNNNARAALKYIDYFIAHPWRCVTIAMNIEQESFNMYKIQRKCSNPQGKKEKKEIKSNNIVIEYTMWFDVLHILYLNLSILALAFLTLWLLFFPFTLYLYVCMYIRNNMLIFFLYQLNKNRSLSNSIRSLEK